ncbi:helix-turn-helix domain-containing protein [Gemmata obscuriglobus]|nr:helix-turn-helix domain-containing protein [Gemmata obscuriglobus]
MTLAEAAAWLRVSEAGLRADADSGRLPARLVAGEWRFNKAALLEWLSHPEPPASRPKTGAELVEHIRRVRAASSDPETEEEAEEFIRQMYARRKADSAAG